MSKQYKINKEQTDRQTDGHTSVLLNPIKHLTFEPEKREMAMKLDTSYTTVIVVETKCGVGSMGILHTVHTYVRVAVYQGVCLYHITCSFLAIKES